jgi:3-oxoacyl-[acyl-carrier protein] reductase
LWIIAHHRNTHRHFALQTANIMQLNNSVAIVTGASREIGAAMAETLAAAGAAVLLAHHNEPERAEAVAARICSAGGRAITYDADLSSVAANEAMVARAVAEFGRLDILAANAGITIVRPFLETDEATWDALFDVNVKGAFFGAQAAAKQMIEQSSNPAATKGALAATEGPPYRIVFSSSVTGIIAASGMSAYGITKAALRHMATILAAELGPHGITVNAIGIGATLNERNLHDNPDYEAVWDRIVPTRRVGMPQDVANALMFLISPQAAMVNGHTLVIDGGWSALGRLP